MAITANSTLTEELYESLPNLTTSNGIYTLILLWILHKVYIHLFSLLPPGPLGFPIIGILPFLQRNVEKTFQSWGEKYGPVICVQLGWSNCVVLNSFDAINQAFCVQSDQFINRPSTFFSNFTSSGGHGIIFARGKERWNTYRKFAQRSLSNNLEKRILEEAENLCDSLEKHAGTTINLRILFGKSAFGVVQRMAIADHYETVEMEDYQDSLLHQMEKHGLSIFIVVNAPWMRFIPPVRSVWKDIVETKNRCSDMFFKCIDLHGTSLDPNYPRDFIDLFIAEMLKRRPTFTRTQLRFMLNDLFLAGTETSTTSLSWIFRYLVLHPEMQERIHCEIDSLIGSDGKVSADLKLPYTRAFIEETFRVRPVAPIGVIRATTENVKFMNYVIPKNTQVIANIWAAHHDPNVWNDPYIFNPERHLDSNGAFRKSGKILNFSIGPRNCLGEKMARIEIFIFLVSILQRLKVSLNPDLPLPCMEGQFRATLAPKEYSLFLEQK